MWELDYKESWASKNWCFWTVMLEKALERPLDCKKIQPVYPKGNQSWIFIGRTDAEAEAAILWPPDAKYWLTGKDSNAGKDCTQEKGMIEDEMVGWNHWLNGHKFEQALRVGDGQGSLVCWRPWGCKESDTTVTELNWTLSTFAPLLHWILLCSSLFMSMHDLQLKTSLILLFKDKLLSKISILLQVMDIWASPVAQDGKDCAYNAGDSVQSLGQEDPLGEAIHSIILACGETHGQRSLVGHSPWGRKESDTTGRLTLSLSLDLWLGCAFCLDTHQEVNSVFR